MRMRKGVSNFSESKGFTISLSQRTLFELKIISSVRNDEYIEMCKNAQLLASKLQKGMYFYNAMDKALSIIERF